MKIIGINPGGNVFSYIKINEDEEIGLIEDIDTGIEIWRYHYRPKYLYKDYEFHTAKNVWDFEKYLRSIGVIKGA